MKKTVSILFYFLTALFLTLNLQGQVKDVVDFKVKTEYLGNNEFLIIFDAQAPQGWYLYSQNVPDGGPKPTFFDFSEAKDVQLIGKISEEGKAIEGLDPMFEIVVKKYKEHCTFKAKVKILKPEVSFVIPIDGMSCNDRECVPFRDEEVELKLAASKSADTPPDPILNTNKLITPPANSGNSGGNNPTPTQPGTSNPISGNNTANIPGSAANPSNTNNNTAAATTTTTTDSNPDLFDSNNLGNTNIHNPVTWTFEKQDLGNNEWLLKIKANLQPGWYIYSQHLAAGGPEPTAINFTPSSDYTLLSPKPDEVGSKKVEGHDPIFNMKLTKYAGEVEFVQKVRVTNPNAAISGTVHFMVCDDVKCLPPTDETFTIGTTPTTNAAANQGATTLTTTLGNNNTNNQHHWGIFLAGFVGGLLALLTPCVFPMVPVTVSFFTKQSKTRKKGLTNAIIYALSIIGIYISLGMLVTMLFGATALNDLATNPWVNIAFFLVFLFFAFSFFGFYEIQLPVWLTNKSDAAADKGGLIGIFFMALTLSLTSFSCTGPIIGTLLVQAAAGGLIGPFLGMAGFSLALAVPFALFAAFPGWLNSLPKSGGWLNSVKVVLGFIELALAIKFLSNADLVKQWGLLKREAFLISWIIICLGMAAYLFGLIRFPHDSRMKKLGLVRGSLGILTLAFAGYLTAGLFGSKLTMISGFPPPDFYSYSKLGHCPHDLNCLHDYDDALALAQKENKPIFVDFTGWACVNCRKMEETVWHQPGIIEKLKNDYVVVSLYVDERLPLLENDVFQYTDSKGRTKTAKTVGDKWAQLQIACYNNNAQPWYILLDPSERMLKQQPMGYDPDPEVFKTYLEGGLSNFKQNTFEALPVCKKTASAN